MKSFVLVRHGQSEDNAGMVSRGLGKTHLTNKGRQQAKFTGEHWRKEPDLIVVSPYIRTAQTAEPTIKRYSNAPVETWQIEEFRQLCAARYEGLSMEDRRPHYLAHWEKNDPDYIDGDGVGSESLRDLTGRLDNLENQLLETDFSNAYIFCHGFFLRAFMLRHTWGGTRPIIRSPRMFYDTARGWHYPNCGTIEGKILEDGRMLLGQIEIDHVPREIRT